MKDFKNAKEEKQGNSLSVFLISLFLLLFVLAKLGNAQTDSTLIAKDSSKQEQSSAKETTTEGMNGTMNKLLNEIKSGNEDSETGTYVMILGVLGLVGIAMFISFRGGDTKPKKAKG